MSRVEAPTAIAEENELLARLRAGDEAAFESLVESYHGTMLAVARNYVKTRDVAEEVVQEAWLGVLKGLDRFEGRSSLKTWILRILVNTAKTRGVREARSVPYSSLAPEGEESAVEPERFRGADDPFPGHWRAYPGDDLKHDRRQLDPWEEAEQQRRREGHGADQQQIGEGGHHAAQVPAGGDALQAWTRRPARR